MPESDDGFANELYPKYGVNPDEPWKSEGLLRKLYQEDQESMLSISRILDCSPTTVRAWLDKFEIPRRSLSQQQSITHGYGPNHVSLWQHAQGYMVWKCGNEGAVPVHRLLAVAEYGFDAVAGNDVHHINGIEWDNRPSNIEPVAPELHQRKHLKIDGLERLRVAELYENGDLASRPLAEHLDYDITSSTVLAIHKEFYGGAA